MTFLLTSDGSHTITLGNQYVTYHSTFGAITESKHVFLEAGLKKAVQQKQNISVLEMGFGTGLNALLTSLETQNMPVNIYYEAIEINPLPVSTAVKLNYCTLLNKDGLLTDNIFISMHEAEWNSTSIITAKFRLNKRQEDILKVEFTKTFDLVYYDAFDPVTQPNLWTFDVFNKIGKAMNPGGYLVTYSSKGSVRRALNAAGFKVEKIPGPPGKREIVRAVYLIKDHHEL